MNTDRGPPLNTWYHNTCVLRSPLHSLVSSISNSKKMRRSLVQLTSFILLNGLSPIDVQRLVRIHRNDDFSNECVDAPLFKSVQNKRKGGSSCGYAEKLFLSYESPKRVNIPGTISELTFHWFWVYFYNIWSCAEMLLLERANWGWLKAKKEERIWFFRGWGFPISKI